jgi:glycosyltransferase involved in cell wall biosynthesis
MPPSVNMTLFSVIIPWYEPTVGRKALRECLKSVQAQRIPIQQIVLHDGPPLEDPILGVEYRAERANDWGHSLRDDGLIFATGEYIVHLNSDNILYPKSLKRLAKAIERTGHQDIYILPIVLRGVATRGTGANFELVRTNNPIHKVVFKGTPKPGGIDAMQLIMKRELWLKYGGWYDKSENGDGIMYERFCKEHKPVMLDILLGEHR